MYRFHSIIIIARPVSAVRASSVTDNLRGRYHVTYLIRTNFHNEKRIIYFKILRAAAPS